jgi:hypothetical protein
MQPAGPGTSQSFFREELHYAARLRLGLETADADGDGITDAVDPDDDNDGMPDDYETGEELDPKLNDAHFDKDGDTMSNLSEFLAGTAAGDSNSFLRLRSIRLSPPDMCVNWSSVSGKVYNIIALDLPGRTNNTLLREGIATSPTQTFTEVCIPYPEGTPVIFIELKQP